MKKFTEDLSHLDKLKSEYKVRSETDKLIDDRRLLVDRVIQGILSSEQGKTNFTNKLVKILEEFGL